MTEEEWLECIDPQPMLNLLQSGISQRKLRFLSCACCRRIAHLLYDERLREMIILIEKYSDGLVSESEYRRQVSATHRLCRRPGESKYDGAARSVYDAARGHAVCRDISHLVASTKVPHRPPRAISRVVDGQLVTEQLPRTAAHKEWEQSLFNESAEQSHLLRDIFGNPFRPVTLDPRWLTSTVLDLARLIYDERAFERMPILADALMDAGCDSEEIIQHCQGPGPHVRGCWVVDLLLGKS